MFGSVEVIYKDPETKEENTLAGFWTLGEAEIYVDALKDKNPKKYGENGENLLYRIW